MVPRERRPQRPRFHPGPASTGTAGPGGGRGARERPRGRGAPGGGWRRREGGGGGTERKGPYGRVRGLGPASPPPLPRARFIVLIPLIDAFSPRSPPLSSRLTGRSGSAAPGSRRRQVRHCRGRGDLGRGSPPGTGAGGGLGPARAPRERQRGQSSDRGAKSEENPLGSRWKCLGGPAPVRGNGGCSGLSFMASTITWRGAAPSRARRPRPRPPVPRGRLVLERVGSAALPGGVRGDTGTSPPGPSRPGGAGCTPEQQRPGAAEVPWCNTYLQLLSRALAGLWALQEWLLPLAWAAQPPVQLRNRHMWFPCRAGSGTEQGPALACHSW